MFETRALGYPVERYRLLAFVLSAGRSGLAGGLYAVDHGSVSLQEVYWSTSGQAVMMVVLGGIGTLWGGVIGACLIGIRAGRAGRVGVARTGPL